MHIYHFSPLAKRTLKIGIRFVPLWGPKRNGKKNANQSLGLIGKQVVQLLILLQIFSSQDSGLLERTNLLE